MADRLGRDGLAVVTAGWVDYDERMPWGADSDARIDRSVDFEDAVQTANLVRTVAEEVGPVSVLVLCHAESVDSDIRSTTVESFDRHMAVNARASWQLVRALASQVPGPAGSGRIVALTSDHTAGNLPYGASKGALDRIVLAAARELADLGITANVVNPGPTDTGWMTPDIREAVLRWNLQPRIGTPEDAANLVSFLVSEDGGWVNGQLIVGDGGRR